jgi:hypothetical protein
VVIELYSRLRIAAFLEVRRPPFAATRWASALSRLCRTFPALPIRLLTLAIRSFRTAARLRATVPRTPRPPLAIVPPRNPATFIEASCVALRFPLAVFSLPPRTVAPLRPIPLIRPRLSRFSRLPALVAALRDAGVLRFGAPPPGELANLPLLSRV